MGGRYQGQVRRRSQSGGEPGRDDDCGGTVVLTYEGQNMVAGRTFDDQGQIGAFGEQPGMLGAQGERAGDDRLLDPTIPPVRHEGRRILVSGQSVRARGEVDGATVIGVDEGEIPELRALIKVADAGTGDAQHGLAEAIDGTGEG